MDRYVIPETFDREALTQQANERHERNFNCAQSVACTLAPLLGADEDTVFRLSEGFGGGLGGHTETCGALLGATMVVSLANSAGCADPTSKDATYRLDKELVERFRALYGTTVCNGIRAQDKTGIKPLAVCLRCIREGVMLAIDQLEKLRDESSARAAGK